MMIEDSVVAALQSVTMVDNLEIYRSANLVIKKYGDRAEIYALGHARRLSAQGAEEGSAT